MDISTEITKENIDKVRDIVSKLSSIDIHAVRLGSYLNLDTEWNKKTTNLGFIFILQVNSILLRRTAIVSYEEFKQALFIYLMEN